jgi:signal transduction histidine kinase
MKKRYLINYLIRKKFQIRISIKFLLIGILSSFLGGIVVFYAMNNILSNFVPFTIHSQIYSSILLRLIPSSIVLILIIFAYCIIITHRIAGPIYRLEETIDKLSKGEKADFIVLRDGDELTDLANKMNKLVEKLNEKEYL